MKESCMQEYLYKYFQAAGQADFLNEAQLKQIKQMENRWKRSEKKRKISDANIENNGPLWA